MTDLLRGSPEERARRRRRLPLAPAAAALLLWAGPALAQTTSPEMVVGGVFNSTLPTYSDKQRSVIQTDSRGRLILGEPAAVVYTSSAALAANQVIKASAGNLYSFDVSADGTLSAAAWWIMIYDATSAPVDGAVTPAKCYAMPAGTTGYAAAFFTPLRLTTGVTIGVSTNGCFTKAESIHAFISGDAQ